jgi:hypothetical protein
VTGTHKHGKYVIQLYLMIWYIPLSFYGDKLQ